MRLQGLHEHRVLCDFCRKLMIIALRGLRLLMLKEWSSSSMELFKKEVISTDVQVRGYGFKKNKKFAKEETFACLLGG